jgi:uncharacterized protein YycO
MLRSAIKLSKTTTTTTTKVIPIITGATGTISKSLRQYLSNIAGKHKIKEQEKAAILDTAHILWKVLM